MNDDSLRLLDEETPLLNTGPQHQRSPTPLPKLQIAIVLLLQVCEPLTSQSIYPYINKVSDCEVNRSGAFSLIRCYVSDSLLANSISQGVTSAKWDIMLGWLLSGVNQIICIHWLVSFISGVSIFRCRGYYCSSMESSLRPHWSKASYSHRSIWNNLIHARFWSLSYFLDVSSQVLFEKTNLWPSAIAESFSSRCLSGLLNGNIGRH